MSETQGEVRVRSVRTQRSGNLVETVLGFGSGIVRTGLSGALLPFTLLPGESRQHIQNAAKEVLHVFAGLPGDFAKAASVAIEEWAAKTDSDATAKTAPKDELAVK